jgi:hypothetical protein
MTLLAGHKHRLPVVDGDEIAAQYQSEVPETIHAHATLVRQEKERMPTLPQLFRPALHAGGFVERFLYLLLFVWPYRCDDCDVRFLGFQCRYACAPDQPSGLHFEGKSL